MRANNTIIPIQTSASTTVAADNPSGCGRCAHGKNGPICHIDPGVVQRQAPIELHGPPERLAPVLDALRRELVAMDGQEPLPLEAIVQRLSLDPQQGEVELVLAVAPRCGTARLAETAFQTLRRLLPETDIYVHHAPA